MSGTVIEASEASIEQGSQSFAAAARLFDRRTREDAVMLYAWCRHCDDVIDGQDLGHGVQPVQPDQAVQMERLKALKEKTRAALSGQPGNDVHFEALRLVAQRNEIHPAYPQHLLEGFAMDVRRASYKSLRDTEIYCYHVAGVVGLMMAMIMGARRPDTLDRASDLGMAFQITNICRDIVDDARAGRCYVPADFLEEEGLALIDAADISQREPIHRVARRLLKIADRYYESAYCGLADLPFRSAWAIASARRVYRAIGRKLVRFGPTAYDGRVSTSAATKAGLVVLALGDVILTRFYRPRVSRDGLFDRPAV